MYKNYKEKTHITTIYFEADQIENQIIHTLNHLAKLEHKP